MDDYDQACRFTVKLDPPGFFRWLLGEGVPLTFRSWLDTRTVPFPREGDRVLDRAAHSAASTASSGRWSTSPGRRNRTR